MNFGILNVLLNGTLFETGDIELVGIRNDFTVNKLVVQIGCTVGGDGGSAWAGAAGSTPVGRQPEGIGMDLPDAGDAPAVVRPVEPPEAFTVDTTLVFDRSAIGEVRSLYLRYLRLVVLGDAPQTLKLGVAPRFEIGFSDRPVVLPDREWDVPDRPRRRAVPKSFRERPVRCTGAKLVSQAFTRSGTRSLSFYRLPLDRLLTLAGQKYLFDATVFDSIHLVVARKEGRDNPGPRHLALIARVSGASGEDDT